VLEGSSNGAHSISSVKVRVVDEWVSKNENAGLASTGPTEEQKRVVRYHVTI